MSHEIPTILATGQAAFTESAEMAGNERKRAWHRLGPVFSDPATRPSVALEAIGGDLKFSRATFKVALDTPDGVVYVDSPDSDRVIVRHPCAFDANYAVWGRVTDNYEIVTPAEFAAALDPLVTPFHDGTPRLRLSGAGYIKNGRVMFMTFAGECFDVFVNGKADPNELNLNWTNRLDGDAGNWAAIDGTRIVCANTYAQVDRKAMIRFQFGHRQGTLELTQGAAAVFSAVASRQHAVIEAMRNMATFKVAEDDVKALFNYAAPYPNRPAIFDLDAQSRGKISPEKLAKTREAYEYAIERADAYCAAFRATYRGEIGKSGGLDGNLYGVVQAVTDVTDHQRIGSVRVNDTAIALSAVSGDRARIKSRVMDAAFALMSGKQIPERANEDLAHLSVEYAPIPMV